MRKLLNLISEPLNIEALYEQTIFFPVIFKNGNLDTDRLHIGDYQSSFTVWKNNPNNPILECTTEGPDSNKISISSSQNDEILDQITILSDFLQSTPTNAALPSDTYLYRLNMISPNGVDNFVLNGNFIVRDSAPDWYETPETNPNTILVNGTIVSVVVNSISLNQKVLSVNGKQGDVVLEVEDIGLGESSSSGFSNILSWFQFIWKLFTGFTFAELSQITDAQLALVQTFKCKDDGRIRHWKYVAGDTSSSNGGTVVATGSGKILKAYGFDYYTPENFGAKSDGITDDYNAIQSCINAMVSGDEIRFFGKTYKVSDTITVTKTIKLVGVTPSLGNGTKIERTNGAKAVLAIGGTTNYISFGGLESMYVGGASGSEDFIKIDYCIGAGKGIKDVFINGDTTGAHIYFKRTQDFSVYNLFCRHTTGESVNNRGLIVFGAPDTVSGDNNCNDIRFQSCHLEHAKRLITSEYDSGSGRNNSIRFESCKLESEADFGVVMTKVKNVAFSDCQYTDYKKMFDISDSSLIKIDGFAQFSGTNYPEIFGNFTDVKGLKIDVLGDRAGVINKVRCTRVKESYVDSGNQYSTARESLLSQENNRDYVAFFANTVEGNALEFDTNYFNQNIIKGNTTSYSSVLRVKPSVLSRHFNGLTFFIRAKSDSNNNYEVRLVSLKGALDVILGTINATETLSWFKFPILPEYLMWDDVYIQVNNTNVTSPIKIYEFYLHRKYISNTNVIPNTGTWETGAEIKYNSYSGTNCYGAVCIAGGTPGTWKELSYVNKSSIAVTADGTVLQLLSSASLNGDYSLEYIGTNRYNILKFSVSANQYGEANIVIKSSYSFGNNAVFSGLSVKSASADSVRVLVVTLNNLNGGGTVSIVGLGQSTTPNMGLNPSSLTDVSTNVVYLNWNGRFGVNKEPTSGEIMHVGVKDGNSLLKLFSSGHLALQNGGTFTEDASAIFAINSTTRGFKFPRMTTTQRDAISSPSEGIEIYNTTLKKKQFYNGTAWETITSA